MRTGDLEDIAAPSDGIASSQPLDNPGGTSLRRNASARFVAEVVGLVLSLLSAVVVARLLGPAGKGLFSTLWLLVSLFTSLFIVGLGEAAVVMVRQRSTEKHHAISASIAAATVLGLLGGIAFAVTAGVFVGTSPPSSPLAILAAGTTVAISVPAVAVSALHLIDEYIIRSSVVVAASIALSTTVLVIALTLFDGGVTAALAAGGSGPVLVLAAGLHKLRNQISLIGFGRMRAYLRRAARIGAAFQVSTLLIQATGRVDLLIVYKLRNPAEAGTYSVALTIGALVILMPWAVSYATFPRIARLEPAAANILICRCVRTGVAAATLSAVALAALSPLAVPLVFGPDYSPAVGPSLVLLLAGILGGCQMVLSRGIAARGETRPLIISYLVNLAVMVGLDFALIPLFGTMGAAAAFAFSSLAGLSVAVAFYCRNGGSIGNLVPRVEDLTGLLSALPIHTRWTRRP